MLEYNVTRDDFESNDDWSKFIYDLNYDVNGPYYGTANVTGSYALRPGYIMSFYQRGSMDALTLQKMFSVIDPNNNQFPSLLEQFGLTDQYNSEVEFLSEVNRWLDELETFLRGDQAEDDDGRFRAIEAREWRELLDRFKNGEAPVRELRDFFENASYLPELEGWNQYQQDILGSGIFRAPRTWEEVRRILEANGYTPEEIQSVEDSIRAPGGEFQGSLVLPGILRDLGYGDAGWWDVRPASGQPCEVEGGFGTYDVDGNCQDSGITGAAGDPCGYGGVLDEYGTCINQDYSCANAQYAANNPGECGEQEQEEVVDEDKGFQDYVEEVGEGVANTAKGLYDELKDKITGCVGSPLDCIKQIGTAILDAGGIPEECQNMGDPWFCTEKGPDEGGKPCWKDCVSFNLPGLPIPDIPLPPGVVDVGTYRDFENAVKTVGKTIGDIIDGNDSCGPNGDQECTVGQVLEDIGDWARETWEGVFSGVDDTTVDDVLDWLKGILGPVTAGIIWTEIEEEVEQVIGVNLPITGETKDCTDEAGEVYATVGIDQECPPLPVDAAFDCASVNKSGGMVETESQCGGCLQGYDPDGQGGCIEAPIKCPGEQVYDELTGECKDPEPGFVEGDPCKTEAGESGTYNAEGGCVADPVDPTPETLKQGDPCKTENGQDGTLQPVQSLGFGPSAQELECVPNPQTSDPEGGEDGPPCDQPKPGGFEGVAWAYKCRDTHCTDGSLISDHPNNDCSIPIGTEVPSTESEEASPCDQQNRVTNEDGSCGGCKAGYKLSENTDEGCVEDPDYVGPEGGEEEEESSSGGGGGGGVYSPPSPGPDLAFDIAGQPETLQRQRFQAQDFLTPLFSEINKSPELSSYPIVDFLINGGSRKV